MTKTLDENFRDWEASALGFGYGTGEEPTLTAIRLFLELTTRADRDGAYDYEELERELTAPTAWFVINLMGHQDLIEYGTSPRFGWLTTKGRRLRAYMLSKTIEELVEIAAGHEPDDVICYRDACNCGPNGYEEGRQCFNPFWHDEHKAFFVATGEAP